MLEILVVNNENHPHQLRGLTQQPDFEDLRLQKTNATITSRADHHHDFEALHTHKTHVTVMSGIGAQPALTRTKTRETTRAYTSDRFDIEREERELKALGIPIVPQKTGDGNILVDWYTTDDPANPQNWSSRKKAFVGLQILLAPERGHGFPKSRI